MRNPLLIGMQALATVYTLTNKRVAMRIGVSLTMTLNLPYVCIKNADLDLRKSGHGTLAFDLKGDTRLSLTCAMAAYASMAHVTKPARIALYQRRAKCCCYVFRGCGDSLFTTHYRAGCHFRHQRCRSGVTKMTNINYLPQPRCAGRPMVIPLPDAKIWRWMLPAPATNDKE
jgi:hypothetical protein